MSGKKHSQQLARQLFKLSLVNGQLSAERVAGVLGYVEKTKPARELAVLRAYQRLVVVELARHLAVVEHAGPVSDATVQQIAALFSKKYGRAITATARPNPSLLAGLRVRIGDDVYENSVAGQLSSLAVAG
jgi:F-type H+-transporting ATPase subunit delta